MAARKKVGELQDYKERRRRQREINNLEERILLDKIAEGQKRKPALAGGARDRLPLAKDKDVRQLQIEVSFIFLSVKFSRGGGGNKFYSSQVHTLQ